MASLRLYHVAPSFNGRTAVSKTADGSSTLSGAAKYGAWRNWQTRVPQKHVGESSCGFDSRRPDQALNK